MAEMNSFNVQAERINASKTLIGEGFRQTYCMDGNHFEIRPPAGLGEGSCRSLVTRGSVQMTDFNLTFNRDIDASGEFRTPRTELVFCLGEGIEWGTSLEGGGFGIQTGEMALLHGGRRAENCRYHQNARYRFISMDMSPEHFRRLTSSLSGDERLNRLTGEGIYFAKSRITPALRPVLAQIAECSYSGGIRELYLEGKMLELFAVYLNESLYQEERVPAAVKLSRDDMQCLELARMILQQEYTHPPTLSGLSRRICLNEFKLKKGFKEMFGTTVHAYVIEQRLQQAYRLLCEDRLSVSETASRVGYGNVSHFAAAFRKRYGFNPGNIPIAAMRLPF
ncbi:helix-turn-helix transcriptional regulator [Paenibacillus piscarius]|uniref:helix-turn-helix transcriptional regulator n=1 Tax=Paenibacillus piscarius TaxID=1089681 RepID=UPI001EE965C5|nr:AraC family transcriptional regulator [Paenibacillus piscarius]